MAKKDRPLTPLEQACQKAGSQKALGEILGVSQSTVWHWVERAKRGVPAEYVLPIEKATGVSRHALRPDIFGHYQQPGQAA